MANGVHQNVLDAAGVQAAHIASLWNWTLGLCGLVFGLITVSWLLAVRRGRRAATGPSRPTHPASDRSAERTIWAAAFLSAFLLVGLVMLDLATDHALSRLPVQDAVHIELTGHQFWWEARYMDDRRQTIFDVANELHVPVGRPVVVTLKSTDVIHTLWVPNLHGKTDMLPGRPATIVFRADRAGEYRGQCAEFCGLEHALMALSVIAESPADFARWLSDQATPATPYLRELPGWRVFIDHDCARCHRVSGTEASGSLGPDLTHLGSRSRIAAGTLENRADVLAQWIADPQAAKPGTTMPKTLLTSGDSDALVALLTRLR